MKCEKSHFPIRTARRYGTQILLGQHHGGGSNGSPPIMQSPPNVVPTVPLSIENLSPVPQPVPVWLREGQDAISR